MVLKRWQIIAGVVLFVASTAASALSLGRVRGTALLGRGLDLTVQSSMEASEATPEANCFAADVFYGDTRVSPNAVSISPERSSSGELRIRVRASTIVDEPIVTLFVRVSCGSTVSRRYVLLAEVLSDAEASSGQPLSITPATSSPAPSSSPRVAFGGALPSADSGNAASSGSESSAEARRAERAAQRQALLEARQNARLNGNPAATPAAQPGRDVPTISAERAAPRASVVRKPEKAGAPRLQLDLLDLTSANLNLRGSAELSSAPSSDDAVRRQAQALWRMLNASPEEAMQEVQRLDKLEAQARASQDQSKRQAAEIASLAAQLEAAKKERYINPFTIALALLTIAALATGLWFWRRGSSAGKPWWGSNTGKAAPQDEQHLWGHLADGADSVLPQNKANKTGSFQASASGRSSVLPSSSSLPDGFTQPGVLAEKGSQGPLRFVEKKADPIDFKSNADNIGLSTAKIQPLGSSVPSGRGGSMGRVDNTPPASLMPQASAPRAGKSGFGSLDFGASTYGGNRVVAAEELFDIQEQADFFLSLGQPEQAIEVLKNHITENVETSALAYMDLFDIYHRTARESDYTELREEFNRVFNAQVPEFGKYGAPSNGLEDVPAVLSTIQAAWNKPHQAQDVIEESIFRQPDQDQKPLDMLAYRELMLLYALAKELNRPDAGYSMLPISMQSPVLPVGGVLNTPDVDLGDGLVLSSPMDDLLSPEDRTVSLPHPLLKPNDEPNEDGSLDFDLSDSAELSIIKMPNAPKKS
jgi:hypothetical protein